MSWSHGAHTFKFGGDFRDVRRDRAEQLLPAGKSAVNTFAQILAYPFRRSM